MSDSIRRAVGPATGAGLPDGRGSLDIGDFASLLRVDLGLDIPDPAPELTLAGDLGWDSLTLVEVVDWADQRGAEVPVDLIAEMRTFGDLWEWIGRRLITGPVVQPRRDATGWQPLQSPSTRLLPVGPRHEDLISSWLLAPENLVRFRLRGRTLTPDAVRQVIWDGALAQFIVTTHAGVPVGWVAAIEPDLRNRHVHVTALADPEWRDTGLLVQATAVLINHLFTQFDLRKVYAEVLQSNYPAFASGVGRYFEIEGRLTEHEYLNGAYEDVLVLAMSRTRWEEHARLLIDPTLH